MLLVNILLSHYFTCVDTIHLLVLDVTMLRIYVVDKIT
jgi:hypothetical protein